MTHTVERCSVLNDEELRHAVDVANVRALCTVAPG